ncbi:MAG: ABC-2 transporter permease [Clostridiales bacterium]|nr:ABC-2 transporter permease [Clostridiales bacterium]
MMKNILRKEMHLGALAIVYIFILFGLMFMIPGYPVLCGAFFLTLGLYQNYRYGRECNDLLFSALLPIAKKDVVKGKFVFTCIIQMCCFVLMALSVLMRMTLFRYQNVYLSNPLMNANLFALGTALVLFGLFNLIFVGSYFKTGYRTGMPFVIYMAVCFAVITAAEALHHIPGFGALNAFGCEHAPLQLAAFAAGVICYAGLTLLSYRKSCDRFERIDL